MGLSIPYTDYNGKFLFENNAEESKKSNQLLINFYKYLKNLQNKNELPCPLDLIRFKSDLDNGLHFDSSIPQGFGIGSSGAIVAATYDRYCIENKIDANSQISNENILELKNTFSKLESYYHGTSSGLDPLICYLKLPVLIKSKDEIGTVGLPSSAGGNGAIFLLNTGQVGNTQPLVQHFLERCKEEGFRNMLKNKFKKYNDASIEAFLKNEGKSLLAMLNHFQKYFTIISSL